MIVQTFLVIVEIHYDYYFISRTFEINVPKEITLNGNYLSDSINAKMMELEAEFILSDAENDVSLKINQIVKI